MRYLLALILGIATTALLAGILAQIPIFDNPAIGGLLGVGLFIGSIVLWYNLLGNFHSKITTSVSSAKQKIEDRKEVERINDISQKSEQEYLAARRSYEYFSDSKIKEHLE